jgi:hypothetical protein
MQIKKIYLDDNCEYFVNLQIYTVIKSVYIIAFSQRGSCDCDTI